MVKSRTQYGVNRGATSNRGIHHTEMLITINPNKVFISKKNTGFDDMVERLKMLGDFILKKDNLLRLLKFPDGGTLKSNYDLIVEIDPDRIASVEWGAQVHMLHLHCTFYIKHKTKIHMDRDMIKKVAGRILNMDPDKMHINFTATGLNSFKDYVKKTLKNT